MNLGGKVATRRYYPCVRLALLALIAGGTLVVFLNKLGVVDKPIEMITTAIEPMRTVPTEQPSSQPSGSPSSEPSGVPSVSPTFLPTSEPTSQPSVAPSALPSTSKPTSIPSSKAPVEIELILFNITSGHTVAFLEDVDLLNVTELGSNLSIRVELPRYENVTEVLFFFDNELVRNDTESPYTITTEYFTSAYPFPKLSENGDHTLLVVVSYASRFDEKGLAGASFATVGGQPAAYFNSNPPTGTPTRIPVEEDGGIEATQSPSTIVSTTDPTENEATNENIFSHKRYPANR